MTSNYSRRITALFLVLVMIGSPFSTGMVGASGPSDSQTVKITDGVDAWAGSPLTLQTQTDGATTIDDVPNTMTISGAVYGTPKLQPVSIFNPGSTVEFSYGSNSPFSTAFDLNESNTQIHIIKLNESVSEENVDASMIPGTPNELGDLLDKEDTNSNATFTEITSEVSTINDEFSFDHQFTESGQYTVMITSNAGPGSGIQLDGDKIDSINGEIDVIGLEPVAVQDNSVASISLTSSSEPGDNLTFDVKSGLGSDTNHVVAVYNKSTLKNEDIELETPTDIDDTTTADEFTISSSIGFVSGEAILENDVEVLGQTVGATNRNDGPFSVQNIVNRIADEASTETPKLDNDEDTLFASVTGVVGNSSEEVTVRTTNWDEGDYRVNWDEGDYRVVYIATSGDSSDEFSSAETSINIEVEETSGGDDDDDVLTVDNTVDLASDPVTATASGSDITVTVTATEELTLNEFTVANVDGQSAGSFTKAGESPNEYEATISGVSDGSYDVDVTNVEDAAGNTVDPAETDTAAVTVDNVQPSATWDNTGFTVSGSYDLTQDSTVENADTTTYEYTTDGSSYTEITDETSWDTTGLDDGDVDVRITAEDDQGNSDTAETTVTVDNVQPTATWDNTDFTVSGTYDLTQDSTVENADTTTYEYSTDSGSTWNTISDETTWDTTGLADGDVDVRITAEDDQGGSDTATTTVTVDTTVETTSLTATNDNAQEITVTVEADEQLSDLTASDGSDNSVSGVADTNDFSESVNNDETYTYEATYDAGADGDYTVTLDSASDTNGNSNSSTGLSDSVTVDTTGSFSGKVTNGSGDAIADTQVTFNDSNGNQLGQTTTDANGEYTVEDVEEGTYDITASADGYKDDTTNDVEITGEEDTADTDFTLSEAGEVHDVDELQINADFIGIVADDNNTVSLTASGFEDADGYTIVDREVDVNIGDNDYAVTIDENGEVDAEIDPEAISADHETGETDVSVVGADAEDAATDSVTLVHEAHNLNEGWNLKSIPQPAELYQEDVNAVNQWNTGDETYDAGIADGVVSNAGDLHRGMYVDAGADGRLGYEFETDAVPQPGDVQLENGWHLASSNFAIDTDDATRDLDDDLVNLPGADQPGITVYDDVQETTLGGGSTVDAYDTYWVFIDDPERTDRGILAPNYDPTERDGILNPA